MNEQLGQRSSHPGPNMKWYTISWLLPPKRSASVSLPFWPSNAYSFPTLSHGSSRRCRLSSSRSRVNSFSLPNSSFRAASHSACDTTFGPSILLFAVAMIISPLFSFLRRNSLRVIFRMKQLRGECRQATRGHHPSDRQRRTRNARWTHMSPPAASRSPRTLRFGPLANTLVDVRPALPHSRSLSILTQSHCRALKFYHRSPVH